MLVSAVFANPQSSEIDATPDQTVTDITTKKNFEG